MDQVKQELKYATLIIVLGILSIPLCCCYGIGLVLSVIALVLSIQQLKIAKQNPDLYYNIGSIKTGQIIAIVGIIFNSIWIIYLMIIISSIGYKALTDPTLLKDALEKYRSH
jgi:hypothetical protein